MSKNKLPEVMYSCVHIDLVSVVDILNTIIPNIKNNEIAPTPIFTCPVNCETRLITIVPRKEAPFPHMSISPKYSPVFSAGMILVK